MNSQTAIAKMPQTGNPAQFLQRLDGVWKPSGIARCAKKVLGVKSLAKFLAVSYRQLGQMLARYTGRVYSKSTVSIWGLYEGRARMPRKYRMSAAVVDALHRLYRDAVHWLTDGRYAASVRGSYHWRVRVVRI